VAPQALRSGVRRQVGARLRGCQPER
jgi:hypothetical protein